MDEKPLFVIRFSTQSRATNYMYKLIQTLDDAVIFADHTEKYVELPDRILYFWDRLRDDGIQFVKEYDEREFNQLLSELLTIKKGDS